MRFVALNSAAIRGCAIDWDAEVEITDEIRDAMSAHHVEAMRAGVLRRGLVTHKTTFPRGSLVFSDDPDRRGAYVQLPEDLDDETPGDYQVEATATGEHHRIVVDGAQAGGRVDAIIAATTALSRATAQRLIDDGHVRVDDRPLAKAGQRLAAGATIDVEVPAAEPVELVAEPIPLVVLYEDAELIVVDKPAGLVVHPAAGHPRGTLVNALLHHCKDLGGIGGELRPGIVHRLDKDTSGVMVAAKTERALAGLVDAFAAKSRGEPGAIVRAYLGITAPPPSAPAGTLRTLHGRHPTDRKRFSSKVATGKPAITEWSVVEKLGDAAALVRFVLATGRTHQIRVHAADHGWPILADALYARPTKKVAEIARTLGRHALHAAMLEFDHPVTGEHLRFTAPLPSDLEAALAALRARS